jgi:hypothetical protein
MIRERNRTRTRSSAGAKAANSRTSGGARAVGQRKSKSRAVSPAQAETARLRDDLKRVANWKRWGPYLADRQWGTVREDYSADGDCWGYFPHDHARSRAYRWGEDGLLGITDRQCRLCFGLALWNGADPILKERLFGLTNTQGNHGEDVKECYFYLDSTPTHSYMKALYKYPQTAFPYDQLLQENARRGPTDPEFEITDTNAFADNRYFDVFAEYAKAGPNDICIRITVANRGTEPATIHLLPTLWFRNTWSPGCTHEGCFVKPSIRRISDTGLQADHVTLGRFYFEAEPVAGQSPQMLFTENETNNLRLYGAANPSYFVKDSFHQYAVEGKQEAVNPEGIGTKAAAYYRFEVPAGGEIVVRLRLFAEDEAPRTAFSRSFDQTFKARIDEADAFYRKVILQNLSEEQKRISRQAYAGLLWNKQFYHYVIKDWLDGDPNMPPPPASRKDGRNADWTHLFNRDVISMPDKWEYPWYATWDLAFHMIPFARIDPDFAKGQLHLFLREWYMHPNGELPAYEFNFNDANPPVHAWACWRVYKMTGPRGKRDIEFLERAFQKLLLVFTWWVNRKDLHGKHIFAGGFLGLDNIGVFDRSNPVLPAGGRIEQADGTAWMAFFCGTMLSIALELAEHNRVYEDIASKFFEHFIHITDAINSLGGTGLWDEQDGFYYDQVHMDDRSEQLRLRSLVGLIPLLAAEVLDCRRIEKFPGFSKRTRWFIENRQDLARHIAYMTEGKADGRRGFLLAIPSRERLERVLHYMLDENEFLSPFGIRSLSRVHKDNPYVLRLDSQEHRVQYMPAESDNRLFGGNSNWRGPIWFPTNYLLIEAFERYHRFYGDDLRVECPTGSGRMMNLKQVADELSTRLMRIFLPDENGCRPAHRHLPGFAEDPHWRDLILFYECFDGDTGRGVGASHQTGWTALVARMLEDSRRATTTEQAAEPGPGLREREWTRGEKRQPAARRPARARTAAPRAADKRAAPKRKTPRRQATTARR